ncbi:PD-(D/E)XK nuclease family protein [Actinomadura fibrosa]
MGGSSFFAPRVLSIEDFSEEVAGVDSADNITALFEFYRVYLECTPIEKRENFDTFSSWAQTLLYDFNEIDRYLIDYKSFFGYLENIQQMNHWYLQEERTPLMMNYLSFWNRLPLYYEKLRKGLEENGLAYQGMVYRKAAESIEGYLAKETGPFIFVGFNALNTAEQEIIQKMLEHKKAEVFWDIDRSFLDDEQHNVSMFLRQYLKKWPFYEENEIKMISDDFSKPKKIDVIGIPKNIGQAKYVGELLAKMSPEEIAKTAVVLGDENLLLPVLNSLPPGIGDVNITMGFALKNAPISFLFEHLLKMHSTAKGDELYYKDITAISNHPLIQKITGNSSVKVAEKIKKENLVYLTVPELMAQVPQEAHYVYELCFKSWKQDPSKAIENLQELVLTAKKNLDRDQDSLMLEFLYQFHLLFNQLQSLLEKYQYVKDIRSLFTLYKDLLSSKTVDFRGKPFTGLQLMGMLESRVLDFETVILTSVNEGVLPAGKSSNSFIPFDLKCAYNLPTYREKDAVYTYHFYHLLQRAERAYLLYNTESGGLNAGEKSRFLLQLEMEKQPQHELNEYTVAPKVPAIQTELKVIKKTPDILNRLQELAAAGISPSALTTYIRNPLDFYKQYVLNIKQPEEVEETVAYNTLGSVVHDTLEKFYEAWIGKELQEDDLEKAIERTPEEIGVQFKKHYSEAPLKKGKNLLIFEVAKRYVTNFLKAEKKSVLKGNHIKIIQIEDKMRIALPVPGLSFPVYIKGTVDRVDLFNGKKRIIDYKTGKVEQSKVEVVDWNEIASDYDSYSKPFQILMYALMMQGERGFEKPVEAGIISFKNLQAGFLKFAKKDKKGNGAKKDTDISEETMEAFKMQLQNLILEIFDPEVAFEEKEIKVRL